MGKKNKNITLCILLVILAVLLAGSIYSCIKAGAESEKEKGYLIKQTKEEQYVS